MQIIKAKKTLNASKIQAFKENEESNDVVQLYIEASSFLSERPLKDLRKFFEDENVENAIQSDDDIVAFIMEDKILECTGFDIRWWIAPCRKKKYSRLNRLFDEKSEVKPIKQSTIKCTVANIVDGNISNIQTFEDEPKALIATLNKLYMQDTLRTKFNSTLKFCFDETADINDVASYKTFQELVDAGVFVL